MKYVFALSMLLATSTALASSVTGTLSFEKKVPFAGLIYAINGGSGPQKTSIDQKDKEFTKKLAVIGPGGSLEFSNSDEFQHNIFANDSATGVKFDVGLMETGQESKILVNWEANTLTRVGCKIHPRMRTYIANIPSNTFQIIEFKKGTKDYSVSLATGSGQNKFVLMIPKYDKLEFTLNPGEEKSLDITRKGKKKASLTVNHK